MSFGSAIKSDIFISELRKSLRDSDTITISDTAITATAASFFVFAVGKVDFFSCKGEVWGERSRYQELSFVVRPSEIIRESKSTENATRTEQAVSTVRNSTSSIAQCSEYRTMGIF